MGARPARHELWELILRLVNVLGFSLPTSSSFDKMLGPTSRALTSYSLIKLVQSLFSALSCPNQRACFQRSRRRRARSLESFSLALTRLGHDPASSHPCLIREPAVYLVSTSRFPCNFDNCRKAAYAEASGPTKPHLIFFALSSSFATKPQVPSAFSLPTGSVHWIIFKTFT